MQPRDLFPDVSCHWCKRIDRTASLFVLAFIVVTTILLCLPGVRCFDGNHRGHSKQPPCHENRLAKAGCGPSREPGTSAGRTGSNRIESNRIESNRGVVYCSLSFVFLPCLPMERIPSDCCCCHMLSILPMSSMPCQAASGHCVIVALPLSYFNATANVNVTAKTTPKCYKVTA